MTIDSLSSLATLVLVLSAANERLIEAIKNLAAPWLATKKPDPTQAVDPTTENRDLRRQFLVQLLSILLATSVAAWVGAGSPVAWGFVYKVSAGKDTTDVLNVSAFMLGFLTSGGAAFWNSILDFTREAAKLRQAKVDAVRRLDFQSGARLDRGTADSVQINI